MKLHSVNVIVLGLVAAVTTDVAGEPRFIFEGGVGSSGSELFILPDTATELTLSLANDSSSEFPHGGAGYFDFGGLNKNVWPDGVSLDSWDWIFPDADDQHWVTSGLPNPFAQSFFLPIPVPPNSESGVEIAKFWLNADRASFSVGESFELILGHPKIILGDGNTFSLPVTNGSERVTINIVPEPATLAVLAALPMLFRKRR